MSKFKLEVWVSLCCEVEVDAPDAEAAKAEGYRLCDDGEVDLYFFEKLGREWDLADWGVNVRG